MNELFLPEPPHLVLDNDIPLYIGNPAYLPGYLQQYEQLIKNYRDLITRLQQHPDSSGAVREAMAQNAGVIAEIRDFVHRHIDPAAGTPPPASGAEYLESFKYLYRDWSYNERMEAEVLAITGAITKALNKAGVGHTDRALVPGAGTGRLAVELASICDTIVAFDNSFTMAYWFRKLAQEAISFSLINLRNVIAPEYKAVSAKAYLKPELAALYRKVTYLLADARHLPYPDHTFNAIFSVFFTDLLPLSVMLPEAKRLLDKGGLFIHFGPLSYHFKKAEEMYTANELITVFEANGFRLLYQDTCELCNFNIEGLLHKNVYNNLIYLFTKDEN